MSCVTDLAQKLTRSSNLHLFIGNTAALLASGKCAQCHHAEQACATLGRPGVTTHMLMQWRATWTLAASSDMLLWTSSSHQCMLRMTCKMHRARMHMSTRAPLRGSPCVHLHRRMMHPHGHVILSGCMGGGGIIRTREALVR